MTDYIPMTHEQIVAAESLLEAGGFGDTNSLQYSIVYSLIQEVENLREKLNARLS